MGSNALSSWIARSGILVLIAAVAVLISGELFGLLFVAGAAAVIAMGVWMRRGGM